MVLGYHVIFAAYGFWLPNDPRGSWSEFVAAWELVLAAGRTTRTSEIRSVASDEHDFEARALAKRALKNSAVEFTGRQALAVGHRFAEASGEGNYVVRACAILPDHVHLVIDRMERQITRAVGHLKSKASGAMAREGVHPFEVGEDGARHSPWGEGCWKVYLNTPEAVRRAIDYVETNPAKEGKKRQRWSFAVPFGE